MQCTGAIPGLFARLLWLDHYPKGAFMDFDANTAVNWFKTVVTERYVKFDGRARRTEFWNYALVYFVIWFVLLLIQHATGSGGALTNLLSFGLLLPSLGVSVRRLHDLDKTGWWVLAGLVPILGWALLLYWYAQPGVSGSNQYGTDPKMAQR